LASVTLKQVSKKYDKVVALDNLSLSVSDGEFTVILGPSGCGKSTALYCIAGLESVDSGEIFIGDKLVNDIEPKDRDVSMVFQNYALYPHMTVEENIAFPLKMHKASQGDIRRKVREAAETLQIGHLLQRKPRQVSGGEAQRVAVARAIVREPVVFLMDEPLSNLDANLRLQTRVELKRLQRDLKITTVYVTHDQAEAMTMGDKVAVIQRGTLQQVGTPQQIYSTPSDTFVANFVGSPPMNLVTGEVEYGKNSEDETMFVSNDLTLKLPEDIGHVLSQSNNPVKVLLGVRPEDLSILSRTSGLSVSGTVYEVEPLGSHSIVDVKVGGTVLKVQENAYFPLKLGDAVTVYLAAERLHLFNRSDGKIIV
jgi:multiple sugar transport system ATP-binding protein